MQRSGNIAHRKSRLGRREYLNAEPTLRKEAAGPVPDSLACNRVRSGSAGFLLLDTSFHPLYVNQEALAVLTYPGNPGKTNNFDALLENRVQSLFAGSNGSRQLKCSSLASGRRCYKVQIFSARSALANGFKPAVAVLLERNSKPKVDLSFLSERYRLTPREVETVDHLAQGLNTEEMAGRMGISPNTVKAFLRSIMMKMAADTRAGIIAKVLQASSFITRETSS